MNLAIILYSGTGNTRSVAERLAEKVRSRSHHAEIREIIVTGDPGKGIGKFQLAQTPSTADADIVVLAAPVMAFSLSPVMKAYINQLELLSQPVLVVITQHLPRPWMGGRQALGWMKRALKRKGGSVADAMIVNWTNKAREKQIEEGTDRLSTSEELWIHSRRTVRK